MAFPQVNWKSWLSVAATTFAGAAIGYLTAHSGDGLKQLASAALAGVSAVVHLLQEPTK
jgi:hypothetical protein